MTITAKNNKEKNTHKESVNLKIKDRTYLDTIEVRKIITLDLGFLSQMIYNHLIEKYIYFFNKNKLNSKEEFFQSYDDIAMGVRGNLSYHLINKGLDELIERGFITRNLKLPEGAKNNIPKHHYLLNMKILNDIVITPEEYKMPNKKKYEIQQDIKYAHSINVKKKNTPKVETTDNKMNDDNSNDELIGVGIRDFEDDNSNEMNETLSNEHTPINPIVEPIKEIKELNEHTPINPIVKPIKEFKTAVKPNRAKAKAIIDSKSNPKINDYLDKLKLTNYDIHFLLSDGYTDGSNKDLDDKKRILNLIADNLIELKIKKYETE